MKARSTLVFIAALLTATFLATWIERESASGTTSAQARHAGLAAIAPSPDRPALARPRALSEAEREWARTAWRYFEDNTDADTGLAQPVAGYPAATLWDSASYLLALSAARRLGIVDAAEFDRRMTLALHSLARLPLVDGALPNKFYSVATLGMVDNAGKPLSAGAGWSALDIARMLLALDVVAWQYPGHAQEARSVVARWDLSRIAHGGELYGAAAGPDGVLKSFQEGRLGYEQYAASGYALFGIDAREALDYRPQLGFVDVYGVKLPIDRRDPKQYGARNFVVSEPYLLSGLEFGLDSASEELAWRVYSAQQRRFEKTGVPTAVSEDHLDRAPYFAYNAVYSDGKAWNTITEAGEEVPALRTLSVKAAFGWYALYRSGYAAKLIDAVAGLRDAEHGWYAGRYEADGAPNRVLTANTNAVVLESLAYVAGGRLLGIGAEAAE